MVLAPFQQAVRTLRANKMRSTLTVLGIVIGIASVIILVSAGRGAQTLIVNLIQGTGSNLVFIIPGGTVGNKSGPPVSSQGIVIKTLTREDARAFLRPELVPSASGVAASVRGTGKFQRDTFEQTIIYQGVDAPYFPIREMGVARGSPITEDHVIGLSNVVVLGSKLASDAFPDADPIGQSIKINQRSFRVVGVLVSKGIGTFGIDQDSLALVPISTAQKLMLGIDYVNEVDVKARSPEEVDSVVEEVTQVLMDRHRITDPDKVDFTIRTAKDALSTLSTITSALTLFLAAIAGISLVVGGIGIMNIMLVAVTERTREIGLRKAVGATRGDILTQFLVEALTLTVLGGLIGISIGLLVSFGISRVGGWEFSIGVDIIAVATGVAAAFGLVFGLYPALKASRLNPIDALRFE